MMCQSPDAALSCSRQLGGEISLLFLPKICFLALLKFYPFRVTCNQSTHFPLQLSPKLIFHQGLQASLSASPA